MSELLKNPKLDLHDFEGMLTVSQSMLDFFELLKRVAPTDTPTLIRGETGTGKELAARALHRRSPRTGKPFRAINCATLTGDLLASELFGHVRGAFTGAVAAREGLFKLADGGTVFLDELAEMPLDVQARLLRVLQEQSFVPLGGSKPVHVDVRIVSATLRSLRNAVETREFRPDLMYRVRVVPLFIPRLVERDGDIEALTWHFIEELNARPTLRKVKYLSREALDAMHVYDWPGNVRELRNVLEYAFVVGNGAAIEAADLTPEIRGEAPPVRDFSPRTEKEAEREEIMSILRKHGGKREPAADELGISRTTLWRKLREHGIA